jgi:hypothetical protein
MYCEVKAKAILLNLKINIVKNNTKKHQILRSNTLNSKHLY